MYYMPDLKSDSIENTKKSLDDAIAQSKLEEGRQRYFYAIELKESGEFIGSIGYTRKDTSEDGMIVELGYFICEKFWGKGIISEAAKAVFEYAFNNGVRTISTGCVTANVASERIMQRLGMKRVRYLKDHSELHGRLYDRVGYTLTRDEWK
jgi:ribosomal-protein-alanine N-acetyltransferase